MNKNTILKALNPFLGLTLLNQALSGLLSDVLSRDTFELIHKGGGITLILGAGLHVTLNWSWIKVNYFLKKTPHK